MSDTEDEYQRHFIRSMFAKDEEDGEDDFVSQHTWTSSDGCHHLIFHLACMAPGHGSSLWNSSDCIAEHLLIPSLRSLLFGSENIEENIKWPPNRCIEFGAGAALPGLALLKQGAKKVVFTDRYVNEETFDALRLSVDKNSKQWGWSDDDAKKRVVIQGHTWGEDVDKLSLDEEAREKECKADVLIASDCIYNPAYHEALLKSASSCIDKTSGIFIVGYSFHMNVPPSQVLNFFDIGTMLDFEVISEFKKDYDGQRGIETDKKRGAVYVKVLAHKDSIHCQSVHQPPEITAISWTGGKDCNLALLYAHHNPSLDVRYLITFRPEGKPFRAHPLKFMEAQSESLCLELLHCIIPEGTTDYMQVYVDKLREVRDKYGIKVIVTGDMDLVGKMEWNWIERCCEQSGGGMRAYLPLWNKDRSECLEELLMEGFDIVYSCVKAPFFDGSWINRSLDRDAFDEMKAIVDRGLSDEEVERGVKPLDLCGERGEYHTMCIDGPLYNKRVVVEVNREPLREDLKTNWQGNIHNADSIWMISLK
ncbi:predicted protein [Thalassiosira pseudonana CCMP1335]|uniref:Diphthine--ammonia ligase n=1 Tax=Thalassiosira pseudonana TaxID=35128 RepID=B8CC94_THAPS|nr:predicted protein [Thalassiosira pseudonana CCMP1335]EED88728.1 predicted protein [Thalassiosira pseudonana CCMP1335]